MPGKATQVRVNARIKPGSRKGPLVVTADDGTLELFVRAPAVDGKANKAAIDLLAQHYGVPRSAVRLVAGAAARHKHFDIDHPTRQ
jgi:uncharacterized protein (TIGR00251 family)